MAEFTAYTVNWPPSSSDSSRNNNRGDNREDDFEPSTSEPRPAPFSSGVFTTQRQKAKKKRVVPNQGDGERIELQELEEARDNPVAPPSTNPTTNPTANPEEAADMDGRRSRIWKWIAVLLMLVLVLVVLFLVLAVIFLILRSWTPI
ncbi:unnamed protein product [Calypogeia fissa]